MKFLALVALVGCGAGTAQTPAPISNAPTAPAQVSPAAPAPVTPAPAVVGRLPIGSGAFGSAHPTLLRAYDKQERWVALCQARKDTDGDGKIEIHSGHHGDMYGDEFVLYLILGGGEGTPIDALPAVSEDGRRVVAIRENKLWLVDTQTGALHELVGADLESDNRPGMRHRAAVFSGDRVLFTRHRASGDALVIHDPSSHAEREIAFTDRIWRLVPDSTQVAQVITVPQGQGFPQLMTSLAAGECLGPPMSYSTGGQRGPTPTFHWYDLDGGKEVKAEGIVATIGNTFVRAPKDGALYLDNDQIAPPTCAPQVLAVMPSPPRVIAICGAKKQARIVLVGKGISKELAAIDRDTDHYDGLEDMLSTTGVVCGSGLHCVAVASGNPVDLKGGVAEYVHGDRVYLVHATMSTRTHEIVDVVSGARTPTKGADEKLAAGDWIIDYNDNLVDLKTGAIRGKTKDALRLASTGRILRGPGKEMGGPLSWSAP